MATLLRQWATTKRYGNASTPEFTALAERLSGKDLDAFFRNWLFVKAASATAQNGLAGLPRTSAPTDATRQILDNAKRYAEIHADR